MNKVLLITYYFPPYSGGAVIRVHNFAKYLPVFGYEPIVLTVKEKYYELIYRNDDLLDELPDQVIVRRTSSLEPPAVGLKNAVYGFDSGSEPSKTKKIVKGIIGSKLFRSTLKALFFPDRYVGWVLPGAIAAIRIIRKDKPAAVLVSGPPFSPFIAAFIASRLTGCPLILDFRDDWIGNEAYRQNGWLRSKMERALARAILKSASLIIAATNESANLLRETFSGLKAPVHTITNGFDPDYFLDPTPRVSDDSHLTFVHSGSLTKNRTPAYFFQALKQLFDRQPEAAKVIKVRFLGAFHENHLRLAESMDLMKIVNFEGNLPPRQVASALMQNRTVCLIFQRQVEGGNTAIPGKLFEYMAAKKPILCMDDSGATSRLMADISAGICVGYSDVAKISNAIEQVVIGYASYEQAMSLSGARLAQYDRKALTGQLAKLILAIG